MGRCRRCSVLLFAIFTLQLISAGQRQVFDLLGRLWLPIFINFFQILFTILALFGVYQGRAAYVTVYAAWEVFWMAWNAFVICFYLQVGVLSRDDDVLNLSTGSRSWWEANGFGCVAKYNKTLPDEEAWNKPASVEGCLVKYYYVECVQAALQMLLALLGFVGGCYAIRIFGKQDDSFATSHSRSLPYSIEFQRQPGAHENPYQRPMTPRKVKRRSTRSKRGVPPRGLQPASHVAATPNGRQSFYQNPVTRLMALNAVAVDSSTSNDDSFSRRHDGHDHPPQLPPYAYDRGHLNLGYQASRPFVEQFNQNGGGGGRRPSPIYMNDSETVI